MRRFDDPRPGPWGGSISIANVLFFLLGFVTAEFLSLSYKLHPHQHPGSAPYPAHQAYPVGHAPHSQHHPPPFAVPPHPAVPLNPHVADASQKQMALVQRAWMSLLSDDGVQLARQFRRDDDDNDDTNNGGDEGEDHDGDDSRDSGGDSARGGDDDDDWVGGEEEEEEGEEGEGEQDEVHWDDTPRKETSNNKDDEIVDFDGTGGDDDEVSPEQETKELPQHCLDNSYHTAPLEGEAFDSWNPHHHLVFIHVPKAGGSTFVKALRSNTKLGLARNWCGDYPKIGKCFCLLKRGIRLFSLPPEEVGRAKVIEGHFKFGVHRFLPKEHLAFYTTLLREPKSRYMSQWKYSTSHKLIEKSSMKTFVESNRMLCNWQTALLGARSPKSASKWDSSTMWAGVGTYLPDLCPPYTAAKEAVLTQAMARITRSNFPVAMILERMPESLCVFAETVLRSRGGHRALCGLHYKTYNRAPLSEAKKQLIQLEMARNSDRIDENNALDARLYEFAWKRLEEQLNGPFKVCKAASFTEEGLFYAPVCDCLS